MNAKSSLVTKFSLTICCFNYYFLSQYPYMLNYQYYPLNLTHGHTPNNLILNTKIIIETRFHFLFTKHHIVQCKVRLFLKNIITFYLFLLNFTMNHDI